MNKDVKILLVDENGFERSAVRHFMEMHVPYIAVAEAESPRDVFAAFQVDAPDIVVFDLPYDMEGGLRTVRLLRDVDSQVPIMVVSLRRECDLVAAAYQAGASCYLAFNELPDVFSRAVEFLLGREPGTCCREVNHESVS